MCLVGRNGAGKTTTIDTIMGLLPPRAGRDHPRRPATSPGCRPTSGPGSGIGYAPEDAGIFPDLTVAENFQISRWLAGRRQRAPAGRRETPDERVFAVFPEVRSFLDRRGLHLCGGQKKMVAIARAMTLSPSILLLDEPFEGLAPVVVSRFIEAVKSIKAMGISLLIAESNLRTPRGSRTGSTRSTEARSSSREAPAAPSTTRR